ncbi:carboxypeptidase regulatory-like domain-containing protein [Singulisphaera sp. Ch08]|uniref:Carboxypeptidase regulatory-like domain-containing protein n=1 Tax=Singulisphaera sp. Ch08 TaxID=3120278 RepID=A0AAU7C7F6_9BACT
MRRSTILAALVAALSIGCGSSEPRQVPVTGKLTLNGEPLEGASVTFAPDPTNPVSTPGGASSGPDGAFTVKSADRDGLAPGKYKVLVIKSTLKNGAKVPDEFKDDPMMLVTSGLTVESLPPEYGNADTSPLRAEVTDDGDEFEFDVKQTAKKKK